MKVLLTTLLFITFSLMSFTAKASGINNQYTVHEDAQGNIYIKQPDIFFLIHTDVSIPIKITPKNGLIKLSKVNDKWNLTFLTKEHWNSASTLFIESSYSISVNDFMGDSGLDIKLIDNTSRNIIALEKTKNSYVVSPTEFNPDGDFISTKAPIAINEIPSESYESTSLSVISGNARVTQNGEASYRIPFILPKGIGNYQPSISLSYSSLSEAGGSILGLGWSIDATNTIYRCSQSLEEDGKFQQILFNKEDKLCFNGDKLQVVTGNYLSDGAVYRLDSASDTQIIQNGDGLNSSFLLTFSTGERLLFGTDSNNVLINENAGEIYQWKLAEKRNVFDQNIKYSYVDEGEGEVNLETIEYSGNIIKFEYESRNDTSSYYAQGNKKKITKRLKKVISYNHQNLTLQSYHFDYRYSQFSDRSLLTAIELCNGNLSGICSKPTEFEYSDQQVSGLSGDSYEIDIKNFSSVTGNAYCKEYSKPGYCDIYSLRAEDINADGTTELIVGTRHNSTGKVLVFEFEGNKFSLSNKLSNSSMIISKNYFSQVVSFRFDWSLVDDNGDSQYQIRDNTNVYFDWDGDGVDELSPRETTNTQAYSDEYTYPYNHWLEYELDEYGIGLHDVPIDYNGDGLIDRLIPFVLKAERVITDETDEEGDPNSDFDVVDRPFGPPLPQFSSNTSYEGTYWLLEINRTVGEKYTGEVLYLPQVKQSCQTGECFPLIELGDVKGLYSSIEGLQGTVDINGDGVRGDYISLSHNYALLRTGLHFDTVSHGTFYRHNLEHNKDRFTSFVDINGDGKDDYVFQNIDNGTLYWRQSYEDRNSEIRYLTDLNWGNVHRKAKYIWADLDQDNQQELIYFDQVEQKIYVKFDSNTSNEIQDKLIQISNGLGKDFIFNYKRLNDNSVYKAHTNASDLNWGRGSKVRDIVSTMSVVSLFKEAKRTNVAGNKDYETTSYFYEGFKSQAGGKGALGFAKITVIKDSNQQKTVSFYQQEPPFNGKLFKQETFMEGVISHRSEVTEWWNLSINNGQSRFIAPKTTIEHKYFVNSEAKNITSGILATETTKSVVYENVLGAGYPLKSLEKVTIKDHLSTVLNVKETSWQYDSENTQLWHIQRPTDIDITYSRAEQPNILQSIQNKYDISTGVLKSTTKNPRSNDNTIYLQTSFVYDAYGNRVQETRCSLHYKNTCDGESVPDTSTDPLKVFRRKTTVYDSEGRYKKSIGNTAFVEKSYYFYNKFGQPTEIRTNQYDNKTGLREHLYYNSFGQPYARYENTGAASYQLTLSCINRSDCPIGAVLMNETHDNSQPNTKQYIDISGKVVRQSTQLIDGRWSNIDTLYNKRGLAVLISQPYIEGETIYSEKLSYDGLDRKSHIISASGLQTRFSYLNGQVIQLVSGYYSDETSNAVINKTRVEHFNGLKQTRASVDSLGNKTSFNYNALGLPVAVIGVDGITTTLDYNVNGHRILLDDTDKGRLVFTVNALGEIATRTTTDNVVKSMYRNTIGQTVRVHHAQSSKSDWDYFDYRNSPYVHEERNNGNIIKYEYDNYHRQNKIIYHFDSHTWSQSVDYDQFGRVFNEYDISGNGRGLQHQYQNGYLNKIFETQTGQAYYRASEMDAQKNIVGYVLGNDVRVDKKYNAKTGYLSQIYAGLGRIQHHEYRYDQLGNLRHRSDRASTHLVEYFTYDELNRLENVYFNGLLKQQITYYDNGNIRSKSDVVNGDIYAYAKQQAMCNNYAGAHALTAIGQSRQYCYDKRGNQISVYHNGAVNRTVSYSLYDKPLDIWSENGQSQFRYTANKNKYKRHDINNGKSKTTYYVGNSEVIYHANGTSEIKRYIHDIAVQTIESPVKQKLHYVFKDHISSDSIYTDESGKIVAKNSFDAFGKRRNGSSWTTYENPFVQVPKLSDILDITERGFTGHQQIDHASLVHMGGRIYDPEIGRFVQPDPIVQDPRDAQNLNRFSYVQNNPLSYTDPTGYACETKKIQGPDICADSGGPQSLEEKDDLAPSSRTTSKGNIDKSNASAKLINSAVSSGTNQSQGDFWKAVGTELWNNAGDYGKQIITDAVGMLVDNAPEALGDVSGYTSGKEMLAAIEGGDLSGVGWAAVGFGLSKVPGGKLIPTDSKAYSVLFDTKLNPSSYPGVSRQRHFQEANENLLNAMRGDPQFAKMMKDSGVNLSRTPTGLAPRKPPSGFTWHHEQGAGVMRLVPRSQHTPGSNFWKVLHPNGKGGWAIWGKE